MRNPVLGIVDPLGFNSLPERKKMDEDIKCPIDPLGSRIICMKKTDADNAAGLVLPESAQSTTFLIVVAKGPECENDDLKVGMHVLIPLYPSEMIAVETEDDGKKHKWFMMAEKSVPAIMK